MTAPSLRSFRLVGRPEQLAAVEDLLRAEGFDFAPEPFHPVARRLLHEPFPLGASLAAKFGYIYIQDRSSMLPPVALGPAEGAAVLDVCASPGSKTGFLGQLVGPSGFVLGNEPSKNRFATLRRNLAALNLLQCGSTSFSGEDLPLRENSWPFILLDPPCSGWGTVEKNPKVLELWQGDKVKPLVGIQRMLLRKAFSLLAPGGRLVYSTCTTNVEENEGALAYAANELGYQFLPLAPLPGFLCEAAADARFDGCLRIPTGPEGQGFFVALLQKPAGSAAPVPAESSTAPALSSFALARSVLAGPGTDLSLLPEGTLAEFSGVLHFLPAHSRALLPESFPWKGFALGKVTPAGVRLSAGVRALMPEPAQAEKSGLSCLVTEDPALPNALLSGQSLRVEAKGPEMGLYYKTLPLARLQVKGARAVLPKL